MSFGSSVRAWAEASKADLQAIRRDASFELAKRVILYTPVDTGFLRGSWWMTLTPSAPHKGKLDPSGAATLAALFAAVQAPGSAVLYLQNNAHYAAYVEYGTSRMAPRAMVRRAAAEWPAIVVKAKAARGFR